MKLKQDYLAVINNTFRWVVSRFKPLAVHTELVVDDDCWEEIKKRCDGKQARGWYLMTPTNYTYYKNSFNVKLSKEEISKIMKERYL
ncbi:hypothetical protein J4226_02560 [Candidatus Pacearchaeota archaeon]|nr:hypothetical protein [Candidatus Pacearchaeota archaeon]